MRIAIGFDGTIVQDKYPEIGPARNSAVDVIKRLEAEGHTLILWTTRSGPYLEEAVRWCKDHGLVFYSINSNHPDYVRKIDYKGKSPKVSADIYIDASNIGGIPEWNEIYDIVNNIVRSRPVHRKHKLWKGTRLSRRVANIKWEISHFYKPYYDPHLRIDK